MRVTKHEHACLVIEEAGEKLVIDPGGWTELLENPTGVVAVVITHEHPDHWSADQLRGILAASPGVRIFGPQGVAVAAPDFDIEAVAAGDSRTVGGFTLRFFGGLHAQIHPSMKAADNVGVFVNDLLYYTGDSFSAPTDEHIEVLAVTAAAPWLKISEVMDFVTALKPTRTIPVHEGVLSSAGTRLHHARIKEATESYGGEFLGLAPGESIDVVAP